MRACLSAALLAHRDRLFALAARHPPLAAVRHAADGSRDGAAEPQAIAQAAIARDAERACGPLAEHLQPTADPLLAAGRRRFGPHEETP